MPKSPNPIDKLVGQNIRMRRVLANMTQEALAGVLGVTFQQLQKYETGANRVGAGRLHMVAETLNVPVALFFEASAVRQESDAVDTDGKSAFVDVTTVPDAIKLVRVFSQIEDQAVRTQVLELVAALAKNSLAKQL